MANRTEYEKVQRKVYENKPVGKNATMPTPEFNYENLSLPSPLGTQAGHVSLEREKILKTLTEKGMGYWQESLKNKACNNKWNVEKINACLNAITTFGIIVRGAQAAGVSYRGLKQFMDRDPAMQIAVEEAVAQHRAFVEELVYKRGVEGWHETVRGKDGILRDHKGKVIYIHKYDPRLCEMYVRRFCPAYREKAEIDVNLSATGVLVVDGMAESEKAYNAEFANLQHNNNLLAENSQLAENNKLPVIDVEEESSKAVVRS